MKKLILTTLLLIQAANADVAEARKFILHSYAKDPVKTQRAAVLHNYIVAGVINTSGLHPLSPNVDYKDKTTVGDDPYTKEVKQVAMKLNDLKPVPILFADSKGEVTIPKADKPDPLMRTPLHDSGIITQPASATR